MKENMLLQYSDDIVKVGLQSLRTEVLEILAQNGASCVSAVENSAHQVRAHTETKLLQALERLHDTTAQHQARHEAALEQILVATQEQVTQLNKVERNCIHDRVKSFQTRDLEKEDRRQLHAISAELQSLEETLDFYISSRVGQILPAGMKLFTILKIYILKYSIIKYRMFSMCRL